MRKGKLRLIAAGIAAIMLLSCGCGGNAETTVEAATAALTTVSEETTEAVTTEETTEATTEAATVTTEETTEATEALETTESTAATTASTEAATMATTATTATTTAATTAETTAAETTAVTTTTKKVTTTAETTKAPEVTTAETEKTTKYIALTFDDGPNTTTTCEVLDLLEKYGITASFFVIGNNINDESAKSIKRAYDMGCEIDNHSQTHSYMDKLTAEEIQAEIAYTSDKVKEITGEPTRFFRPPYIAVNDTMFDNIDLPFICGVGCNDWDAKITVEKRIKAILKRASDGGIILLHDAQGNSATVEALDTIIPSMLEEGYVFLTVSELFEKEGIEPKGEIIYSNVFQTGMYN